VFEELFNELSYDNPVMIGDYHKYYIFNVIDIDNNDLNVICDRFNEEFEGTFEEFFFEEDKEEIKELIMNELQKDLERRKKEILKEEELIKQKYNIKNTKELVEYTTSLLGKEVYYQEFSYWNVEYLDGEALGYVFENCAQMCTSWISVYDMHLIDAHAFLSEKFNI